MKMNTNTSKSRWRTQIKNLLQALFLFLMDFLSSNLSSCCWGANLPLSLSTIFYSVLAGMTELAFTPRSYIIAIILKIYILSQVSSKYTLRALRNCCGCGSGNWKGWEIARGRKWHNERAGNLCSLRNITVTAECHFYSARTAGFAGCYGRCRLSMR